jgi:hypothetical protein
MNKQLAIDVSYVVKAASFITIVWPTRALEWNSVRLGSNVWLSADLASEGVSPLFV